MTTSSRKFLSALLFIGLCSCKDNATSQNNVAVKDSVATAKTAITKDFKDQKRYVIAPNGLSLRKEASLESEKLTTMPLGSEVVLLEEGGPEILEVEHIKGKMLKLGYDGLVGYAFSGYLSPIRLRSADESTEAYILNLKETFPDIHFESRPTDPDFHEGAIDTYTLPVTNWHEAFYLVAGIYELPKSLGFPNPKGPDKEILEEPNKPEEVWSSDMGITRTKNTLTKIVYSYRAEGFGYSVEITRPDNTDFRIEYLVFVD